MSASSRTAKASQPQQRISTLDRWRAQPWWPWLTRALKAVFFLTVAWLLVKQARGIDWDKVFDAVRQRSLGDWLLPALLAAASYLLYSCFDLLGRHVTGHTLPVPRVMLVNFVSYAFNLNLGSLVGGVAFRYRLYSRLGLDTDTITRVTVMSMLTNWLGYVLLAGMVFLVSPPSLPTDWALDASGLRWLGVVLLVLAAAYLLLCAFARQRIWTVRGHAIELPSLRLALLQTAMSALNWALIAATVYGLLGAEIAFPATLSVLLIAAVAGVLTHVPAGLGVLEAVFLALLAGELPRNDLLAGLFAYRTLYYLLPLALAVMLYGVMEWRFRHGTPAVGQG